MGGVYLITNLINGKKYVGVSNNIKRRFMEHKSPKNVETKTNLLYKAMRKYGVDNFKFEIIEHVSSPNILPEREIYWIQQLKPEYNMNDGGLGNVGLLVKESTKDVLRVKARQQWDNLSVEEKAKRVSNNLKGPSVGHEVSPQTRIKIANRNFGKKQSIETKEKRSKRLKIAAIGNKNGNKKVSATLNGITTVYDSLKQASSFTNVCLWSINQVLKGKSKSSKGYSFKLINN